MGFPEDPQHCQVSPWIRPKKPLVKSSKSRDARRGGRPRLFQKVAIKSSNLLQGMLGDRARESRRYAVEKGAGPIPGIPWLSSNSEVEHSRLP